MGASRIARALTRAVIVLLTAPAFVSCGGSPSSNSGSGAAAGFERRHRFNEHRRRRRERRQHGHLWIGYERVQRNTFSQGPAAARPAVD